nr:putative integron gene cassette protein [uncultured bacterium]
MRPGPNKFLPQILLLRRMKAYAVAKNKRAERTSLIGWLIPEMAEKPSFSAIRAPRRARTVTRKRCVFDMPEVLLLRPNV